MIEMGKNGVSPSIESFTSLIDGYGRASKLERFFEIHEEMDKSGLKPTVLSYCSLMNA